MSAADDRVSRMKHWRMWVGTSGEFRALLRLIEKQVLALEDVHVARATTYQRDALVWAENRLAEHEASLPSADLSTEFLENRSKQWKADVEREEQAVAKAKDEALKGLRLQAVVVLRNDERRTIVRTADELADYLEDKNLLRIEIEAPHRSGLASRISLQLDDHEGVEFYIASDDATWVSASHADIKDEIERRVPRWHFIRARWFSLPLFALASYISLYYLLNGIGDFIGNSSVSQWLLAVWLAVAPPVALISNRVYEARIKAFEIVKNGGRASSRAFLSLFGSSLLAIGLGVFVNAISP